MSFQLEWFDITVGIERGIWLIWWNIKCKIADPNYWQKPTKMVEAFSRNAFWQRGFEHVPWGKDLRSDIRFAVEFVSQLAWNHPVAPPEWLKKVTTKMVV